MKHFFFLLLSFLCTGYTASAQNESLNNFIEKHKSDRAFTYAFLSKDLFEVATHTSIKGKEWNGLHNVVKNIGSLRILAADSIQNALPLYKEARAIVLAYEFDELLTVRDAHENVRIWVKAEEDLVTDLVLLVGSPDKFVLVCFAGNLELGNLSELAKLFEVGQVEHLVRASEAVTIDFEISPNPSNGEFRLTYSDEQDFPMLLSVIDQNGRQITSLSLLGTATQAVVLGDVPSGMYWLQLKTQNGKVGIKQVQVVKR